MKKILLPSLTLIFFFILASCSDDEINHEWEWGYPSDGQEKPRYVWIDAAANFFDFANSKENIERDLTKAKEAGFTDIVVDVRPTTGDVLFTTNAVGQVKSLAAWHQGEFKLQERTAEWDYLQAFIDAGHKLGLKVHAAINTFVGGNAFDSGWGVNHGEHGMLYKDNSKKDWATSLNTTDGIVNVMDLDEKTKFFNPANDEVQEFLLTLLGDLAKYDLDGIFLDRCRYDELHSDFSDISKSKFEEYIGTKIERFPDQVVTPDIKTGSLPKILPLYFKRWLEFRAKIIHDFVEKASEKVKSVNPDMQFGVYVGGWYSTYYGVGVNWGSPNYNTAAKYPAWASKEYQNYGYADHTDVILIGAYAAKESLYGTGEWSVQGFCSNARWIVNKDAVVIGGPDIGNGTWAVDNNNPEESLESINQALTQSIDAAINACDGYFLFDIGSLRTRDQWQYIKAGVDKHLESINPENKE